MASGGEGKEVVLKSNEILACLYVQLTKDFSRLDNLAISVECRIASVHFGHESCWLILVDNCSHAFTPSRRASRSDNCRFSRSNFSISISEESGSSAGEVRSGFTASCQREMRSETLATGRMSFPRHRRPICCCSRPII